MLASRPDLSFAYARRRRAPLSRVLDGVSLDVAARAASSACSGPNGSGKTTLLRIIAGLLTPQSGRVLLDGQPIAQLTPRELARRIAVVPQETHATFDFTVLDMVLMGRYPHLGTVRARGRRRPGDRARRAGGDRHRRRSRRGRSRRSSGGEKQRVVIASALAQASDMLLLDEPTAALDLGYQFEIAALLRRLNAERGTTMVVSTHDLNLAAALCERVVLLKHGPGDRRTARPADTLTAAEHPAPLRRRRRRAVPRRAPVT